MLSHLHLAIIAAVVVLLLLVLYVYMNPTIITTIEADYYDYPIYTLTTTYTAGTNYSIANDLAATHKFVTNQTGDGIFYETQPPSTATCSLAILVVKCAATDYATALGTNANITSSTTPYVGILVQYTPASATGTMSKYLINPDNSTSNANALNWMGAVDLTLLFATAAKAPGFNMNAIGVYTGDFPTVNKVASTNATFPTATSVTKWPPAVGGVSLVAATASAGKYGLSLTSTVTTGVVATS